MSTWARAALLLACAAAVSAASPARAATIGAILGLDRGAISGDAPPNTKYGGGMGWIAGEQVDIPLTSDLALSLQPRINHRSTKLTSADEESPDESVADLDLDYVSVPLVLKLEAAGGRTYVAGGVDLAFLTSAQLTGPGIDKDIKSLLHGTDVGALVGFGVVFPVGTPRLTTELRYVQGLVNLSNDSEGAALRNLPDRFHMSGWQLTAGILFPLGKR